MPGIIIGPGIKGIVDAGAGKKAAGSKPAKSLFTTDPAGLLQPPGGAFVTKASHDAAFLSLPVAKRQKILSNAGFQVAVDGVVGPQTETATRAFLKGVSPSIWNHAWTTAHTPLITNTRPAPTVFAPAPAPARVPAGGGGGGAGGAGGAAGSHSILDQILGGLGAYKPPTTAELMQQAKQLAQIQLGPQVTLLQQQQDQATADAARRAELQGNIGAALAEVLKSQGPEVQQTYHAAGADQAGLASGFSGDLRSSAAADAQKINDLLDSIGAPSAQHIDTSKSDAIANVAYGLGGYLPSSALAREGAAFSSAADLLPQTATGQGAQLAANELQAGADQKKTLATQLAAVEAQRPGLVQAALAQVQDAATKNAAAAQNQALLPLLLAGKFDSLPGRNPITGTKTSKQASLDNQAANTDLAGKRLQVQIKQLGLSEAKLKVQLATEIQTQKEKGSRLGLDAKTYQRFTSQAKGAARNYHSKWVDATGKEQDPLSWQQYLTHGLNAGIPVTILIAQGKKVYSHSEIKQGLIPGA